MKTRILFLLFVLSLITLACQLVKSSTKMTYKEFMDKTYEGSRNNNECTKPLQWKSNDKRIEGDFELTYEGRTILKTRYKNGQRVHELMYGLLNGKVNNNLYLGNETNFVKNGNRSDQHVYIYDSSGKLYRHIMLQNFNDDDCGTPMSIQKEFLENGKDTLTEIYSSTSPVEYMFNQQKLTEDQYSIKRKTILGPGHGVRFNNIFNNEW